MHTHYDPQFRVLWKKGKEGKLEVRNLFYYHSEQLLCKNFLLDYGV